MTRSAGPQVPIVRSVHTSSQANRKLAVESVAFGLGYTAVLIWSGTALVASFSAGEASPYWPVIPQLRTDTTGVVAFAVAILSLVVSRYLQLRRRSSGVKAQPAARPAGQRAARSAGVLMMQAVAETAAVLGTAVVVYLSVNAVTHPATLRLHLTHLWPWPTEGTVRVIALGICGVAVASSRYLRATANRHSQPAAVPGNTDVNADVAA